jgi:hypothetical protein
METGGFSTIVYQGKEIAYFDFRKMREKQMIQVLEKAQTSNLEKYPLVLTDFRDTFILPDFLKRVKEMGFKNRKFVKKSAVLGMKGGKLVLLKFYNLFTKYETVPFQSFEAAREWLVKD